jgi:hypothetical protein
MPNAPKNKESGFTVIASEADGALVPVQILEAKSFLETHRDEIRTLTRREDVEAAYLDFGWNFPVGESASVAQFNHFPRELISICAELDLGLEVSVYATEDE